MSIAPFSTSRVPVHAGPPGSWWRTRLAVVSASVGIAATLLAYAISPGLRHAVVHAERSVRHAVTRVFDKDAAKHKAVRKAAPTTHRARTHRATPATGAHGRTSSTSTHRSTARANSSAPGN
jgi:hypothetical protein